MCEIMNVVHEEAMDSYNDDIILELRSNTVDEMEDNIDTVKQFVDEFRQRRQGE
jgi:adenylate kinase